MTLKRIVKDNGVSVWSALRMISDQHELLRIR
jgi:hypothetical protein